jgi:hypothetical protein
MNFFLSYATDADRKWAEEIKTELETAGNGVYIDYESLRKGQDTDERINNLIEQSDAILYLVTTSSIRSFWCGKEIGYAQAIGKTIIPIAGPAIRMKFIKEISIPRISGLKCVLWGEHEKGKKIVEAINHDREIVELLDLKDEDTRNFRRHTFGVCLRIVNKREFTLNSIEIGIEVEFKTDASASWSLILREPLKVLLLQSGSSYSFVAPPDAFGISGSDMNNERFRRFYSQADPKISTVTFLVRYCVGGQKFLSQIFEKPINDVIRPITAPAGDKGGDQ